MTKINKYLIINVIASISIICLFLLLHNNTKDMIAAFLIVGIFHRMIKMNWDKRNGKVVKKSKYTTVGLIVTLLITTYITTNYPEYASYLLLVTIVLLLIAVLEAMIKKQK